MSFNARQIAGGQPVDLYEIIQGDITIRTTSSDREIVKNGFTWAPTAGMQRSGPTFNQKQTSGEITIRVPSTFSLASQYIGILPSQRPTLTIYQTHLDDVDEEVIVFWKGRIIDVSFPRNTAEIKAIPITQQLAKTIPRRVSSHICNHALYDSFCRVERSDYQFVSTIGIVSNGGRTMTIPGLRAAADARQSALGLSLSAGELDMFWQKGFIRAQSVPNEIRSIVANGEGAPDEIRLDLPFRRASPGDAVLVQAGCDHSVLTCNAKFQNTGFYGGSPFVPSEANPFTTALDNGVEQVPARRGGFFVRSQR